MVLDLFEMSRGKMSIFFFYLFFDCTNAYIIIIATGLANVGVFI